jgi:uncharacterized protein YndB with AHSA1/START domain
VTHAAPVGTKQPTPLGMEIEHRTLVRAPRDTVYRALTTAAGFDEWFTTGAAIVPEPGGVMHLRWREWGADAITVEDRGEVVEAIAPERFVFRWHGNGPKRELTTVELDFLEDERGTIVSLRESGYADTDEGRSGFVSCCAGWGEALTLMKFYVEHGVTY